MSFEIWIRTHSSRLDCAFKLKEKCQVAFSGVSTRILNTGDKSKTFSEKFVMLLHRQLQITHSSYILILEDDMLIAHDIGDRWSDVLQGSHCWLSIPSQTALDNSIKCSETRYRLEEFQNFSYSGAVLLSRSLLKNFITHYLLSHQEGDAPNFDVNLSAYIKSCIGHLVLCPGIFGSDITLPSSIEDTIAQLDFRSPVRISELDPLFDRHNSL